MSLTKRMLLVLSFVWLCYVAYIFGYHSGKRDGFIEGYRKLQLEIINEKIY